MSTLSRNGNSPGAIRVIVVEDFEPFRRLISSSLAKRPELQIVAEVSDGTEAVRRAEELKPDLVLLDIGLPTLNGIEAARQIRRLSPPSKILFVSQESDADVVQEAINLGGSGYVLKLSVRSDLLPAIDAVLKDGQFVSSKLVGHFSGTTEAQAGNSFSQSADD
jgi:DNA-binding NarL/FixJ family response regulator